MHLGEQQGHLSMVIPNGTRVTHASDADQDEEKAARIFISMASADAHV